MNIKQIIEARLVQDGYDGLFNINEFDCSCKLGDDFMPCDNPTPNCQAGINFSMMEKLCVAMSMNLSIKG